ncbi:MAG: HAD-IIIA family hydrolase [Candidatus Melainabacteria bacterium]|nr:HAD-IIIA family hydrolase [Candidatus Melainabacteria bacterium]
MDKAVFLDRDGVLNYPVFNPNTNEYEAPFNEKDFKLFPDVIESLKELLDMNYRLFLVSNQPDYAKGKTTLENLYSVHKKLHNILTENNISFNEYYYCYHHPYGIIPEYSIICECRKPGNLFLKQAKLKYSLDMSRSWMIGDRDVDIYCGQSVGTKTIMISQKHSDGKSGQSKPEHKAKNLKEAVDIIKINLGDIACHN